MGDEISTPLSALDRAEAIAARMEAANIKAEELLKQNTEIATKIILGGRSEAGSVQPIIDAEVEKKNKLKEFWKGSVIADAIR